MRLQATEEEIYKIMDRQEWYLLAACGAGAGLAADLYVFLSGMRTWETLYLLLAGLVCMSYFFMYSSRLKKKIMEMRNCYLEVSEGSLAVRQAGEKGEYEACRIFFDEIEKIVEGSRRGIPEFYVIVKTGAKESFFLCGQQEREGSIFQVRSFGYQTEEFREFYREFRWRTPGKVRVIGTKEQEIWQMEKPKSGLLLGAGLAALYLLPKIGILLL